MFVESRPGSKLAPLPETLLPLSRFPPPDVGGGGRRNEDFSFSGKDLGWWGSCGRREAAQSIRAGGAPFVGGGGEGKKRSVALLSRPVRSRGKSFILGWELVLAED